MRTRLSLAIASLMAPAFALAQQGGSTGGELPPVIADLVDEENRDQVEVVKRFPTESDDLEGLLLRAGNEYRLFYLTTDGNYAVIGGMMGRNAENLTQAHMDGPLSEYMEQSASGEGGGGNNTAGSQTPSPATAGGPSPRGAGGAGAVFSAMKNANNQITQGSGSKHLYATLDPNCPYCKRMFRNAQQVSNEVTIHWIPVAMLRRSSMNIAGQLISSPAPKEALTALAHDTFNPDAQAKPSVFDSIAEDTTALQQAGAKSTPTVTFTGPNGQPQMTQGMLTAQQLRQIARQ